MNKAQTSTAALLIAAVAGIAGYKAGEFPAAGPNASLADAAAARGYGVASYRSRVDSTWRTSAVDPSVRLSDAAPLTAPWLASYAARYGHALADMNGNGVGERFSRDVLLEVMNADGNPLGLACNPWCQAPTNGEAELDAKLLASGSRLTPHWSSAATGDRVTAVNLPTNFWDGVIEVEWRRLQPPNPTPTPVPTPAPTPSPLPTPAPAPTPPGGYSWSATEHDCQPPAVCIEIRFTPGVNSTGRMPMEIDQ